MKYALAFAAAVALSFTATAEDKLQDKLTPEQQLLVEASVAHNTLTRLCDLVESRSENPAVEQFARDVLNAQKKAGEKLGQAAKELRTNVVAAPTKEHQQELDRIAKLKGPEFDRAFLETFVRMHEQCLKMCEKQATSTQPAGGLTDFAKECLPQIRDELKRARELREKVGN